MSDNNRDAIFIVLIGPAGAGKSVLAKEIISAYPKVKLSVSATTRKPREGEVDGISYHFISKDDFLTKVSKGEFFEHEEVHGNFYGTLNSEINEAKRSKTDLLFDIDIRGAQTLRARVGDNVLCLAIVPPSQKVLEERMRKRGSITSEELSKRIQTARHEYDLMLSDIGKATIDYFIVNEVWESTKKLVLGIIESEMHRYRRLSTQWIKGQLQK